MGIALKLSFALSVDPLEPFEIYLGGDSRISGQGFAEATVWRGLLGGADNANGTFWSLHGAGSSQTFAGTTDLAFDASNNLIETNAAGIFRRADFLFADDWTSLGQNLVNQSFSQVRIQPGTGNLFASSDSQGTFFRAPTNVAANIDVWIPISDHPSAAIAMPQIPSNGNTNVFFASTAGSGIAKFDGSGNELDLISAGQSPALGLGGVIETNRFSNDLIARVGDTGSEHRFVANWREHFRLDARQADNNTAEQHALVFGGQRPTSNGQVAYQSSIRHVLSWQQPLLQRVD